jgi:tRNA nucleotidyltransferase (CCA-adding enzyme)
LKIYCVGGAVRDELLGLPVHDRDWVVVGATPQAMEQQGYRPVGRDFPVFLHPQTQEEYALARTERKSGRGYRGFVISSSPQVSLEDDLGRRDLTINAMARADDGTLIDPHGGLRDLHARILRHVSDAFTEDPVRILRLARLAARLPQFEIAPETQALARKMVHAGEVDALVPERVWQELSRGLMARASPPPDRPSRMLDVLRQCGALERLLPELVCRSDWPERLLALDASAQSGACLAQRYAVLVLDAQGSDQLARACSERLRVPADCKSLAALASRLAPALNLADALDADALLSCLEQADCLRRPQRLPDLIAVADAWTVATSNGNDTSVFRDARRARLLQALAAVQSVDAGAIAQADRVDDIRSAVRKARLQALQRALHAKITPTSPPESPP